MSPNLETTVNAVIIGPGGLGVALVGPTTKVSDVLVAKCLVNGNNNIIPICVANSNNHTITIKRGVNIDICQLVMRVSIEENFV